MPHSREIIDQIAPIVQKKIRGFWGGDVSQYKDNFFKRQIEKKVDSLGISAEEYAEIIKNSEQEKTIFINQLSVYHTSFFRDASKYEILKKIIFKEIFDFKQASKLC